jgi:hypothetical protein
MFISKRTKKCSRYKSASSIEFDLNCLKDIKFKFEILVSGRNV